MCAYNELIAKFTDSQLFAAALGALSLADKDMVVCLFLQ